MTPDAQRLLLEGAAVPRSLVAWAFHKHWLRVRCFGCTRMLCTVFGPARLLARSCREASGRFWTCLLPLCFLIIHLRFVLDSCRIQIALDVFGRECGVRAALLFTFLRSHKKMFNMPSFMGAGGHMSCCPKKKDPPPTFDFSNKQLHIGAYAG